MGIAKHKTEVVCMSSPTVVPPSGTWGGVKVGGPEAVMVVLGAGITIDHSLIFSWLRNFGS
eukprot:4939457-Amphidinium_carterae.1